MPGRRLAVAAPGAPRVGGAPTRAAGTCFTYADEGAGYSFGWLACSADRCFDVLNVALLEISVGCLHGL